MPQLAFLFCWNRNDWNAKDSDLARFSIDESKLEEVLVDKTLLQVCSQDENKSKGIIINYSSMEEIKSECVHKNVNK